MTASSAATIGAPAPRRRRLVGSPLVWAAICLALVVPWGLAGQATELIPYLLMLVGGWLCGFSFVNATFRMTPVRRGVIVHVIGAIVSAAFVVTAVEFGGALLATTPELVRISFLIMQFAAIPAAGWIWLGLISRVSSIVGTSKAKAALTTPEWVRAEHGHGSEVRFSAVPITMRALTTAIVVIVVVMGGLAAAALVAAGDLVYAFGPRLTVIGIGVVFALPAYLAVLAVVRRRTVAGVIGFGNDRLWLSIGSTTTIVAFRDLERLVWRCRSDYARIEVRGAGLDVSLVTGIAKPVPGTTAVLPALPRRVLGRLQDEGFTLERSRRGEVLTFRRAG
ncbi:hypothetical protein ASD23_03875 [Agromyces sp. Root1464]|uniref:hypothetical protein n=1 Tax=Agromyces sp. Root1464 TaxID=1736467 RepID=UPI0006F8F583|nr:hypothetical protein [Agromyces sp. Root1464]KQZ11233.1 hypothetical protein ASD23_03875 [Agromyces sp. Root1464]